MAASKPFNSSRRCLQCCSLSGLDGPARPSPTQLCLSGLRTQSPPEHGATHGVGACGNYPSIQGLGAGAHISSAEMALADWFLEASRRRRYLASVERTCSHVHARLMEQELHVAWHFSEVKCASVVISASPISNFGACNSPERAAPARGPTLSDPRQHTRRVRIILFGSLRLVSHRQQPFSSQSDDCSSPRQTPSRRWPKVSDFVAHFCTLRESKNTRPCENRTRVFLLAQRAKKCDTNHIPRATAQPRALWMALKGAAGEHVILACDSSAAICADLQQTTPPHWLAGRCAP